MIFIIIWSIWFLSEILLNRLFRSGNKDKKNLDRGTMRIIWITIGIANSIGILSAIFIKFPISSNLLIPYFGLFLIVIGMIFRFISILIINILLVLARRVGVINLSHSWLSCLPAGRLRLSQILKTSRIPFKILLLRNLRRQTV